MEEEIELEEEEMLEEEEKEEDEDEKEEEETFGLTVDNGGSDGSRDAVACAEEAADVPGGDDVPSARTATGGSAERRPAGSSVSVAAEGRASPPPVLAGRGAPGLEAPAAASAASTASVLLVVALEKAAVEKAAVLPSERSALVGFGVSSVVV